MGLNIHIITNEHKIVIKYIPVYTVQYELETDQYIGTPTRCV